MKTTTRDLTSRFIEKRSEGRTKGEADLRKTLEMLAKVSFSFADSNAKKSKKDLPSYCSACSVSFGWWLYVKEERVVCQLCENSFCHKCATKVLSLNNSFSSKPDEKKVRVCNECNELVEGYRRRLEFQEKKREAESSGVMNFYRDTKSFHSQLLELLSKYAETVSMISVADYLLPDTSQVSLSSQTATDWNPLNSLSGWFSTTPQKSKSPKIRQQQQKSSQPEIAPKPTDEPLTPEMDSLKLYQKASQVEQELMSTMQTMSRFLKEASESLTLDSQREQDLVARIKNNAANALNDISSSLRILHRKITQMELQIIEHAFIVTKRILEEIKTVSFVGCIFPSIEECQKVIKTDVETKASTLNEEFEWEPYEEELLARLAADKKRCPSLLNLPSNPQLYKVVVPRIVIILSSLEDYIRLSIAGDYFPNSLEALQTLNANLKELCKK